MNSFIPKIILTILISPLTCFAQENMEVQCQGTEVKVCFADGECLCKERQIELSDPVPQISECVDSEDTGICNS